jgi:pimeloyl-ACP methyl ester carboxylesterase
MRTLLAPDLPECENSAASDPFTLKDASRRVADVIRERIPGRSAHLVGLSIGGAIALQMLCDEPQVLDHLLVSGTATRLPSFLDNLNRPNEKSVHLLNREWLAESLLGQYHVPQAYRSLLLADLRKGRAGFCGQVHERAAGYPYDSSRGKAARRGSSRELEHMLY